MGILEFMLKMFMDSRIINKDFCVVVFIYLYFFMNSIIFLVLSFRSRVDGLG